MKQSVMPVDAGTVALQWPDELTYDEVTDVRFWLELQMRVIERAIRQREHVWLGERAQ